VDDGQVELIQVPGREEGKIVPMPLVAALNDSISSFGFWHTCATSRSAVRWLICKCARSSCRSSLLAKEVLAKPMLANFFGAGHGFHTIALGDVNVPGTSKQRDLK
jgi:hypothetical protein